jgi:hypothetical protein
MALAEFQKFLREHGKDESFISDACLVAHCLGLASADELKQVNGELEKAKAGQLGMDSSSAAMDRFAEFWGPDVTRIAPG